MREIITVKEVWLALLAVTFVLLPAFAFEDAARLQNSGRISAESSKSAIANTPALRALASSRKRARFGQQHVIRQALHVAN